MRCAGFSLPSHILFPVLAWASGGGSVCVWRKGGRTLMNAHLQIQVPKEAMRILAFRIQASALL